MGRPEAAKGRPFRRIQVPTRFTGQFRFSSEGYIDGKNDRTLDACLWHCPVSGKKVLENVGLGIGSAEMGKVSWNFYGFLR